MNLEYSYFLYRIDRVISMNKSKPKYRRKNIKIKYDNIGRRKLNSYQLINYLTEGCLLICFEVLNKFYSLVSNKENTIHCRM